MKLTHQLIFNSIYLFHRLFVLNIDGFIIIHIILNNQINKQVICVVSCYLIINWVVFECVIFDPFIICIMFG